MNQKNRLFFIREYNDLTQQQVADLLGISRSHYSNCELNIYDAPLPLLNKLCNVYNTNIDYIYYLKDSKDPTPIRVDTIDKHLVANNLKYIMQENNLTQSKVAEILNCSQAVISKYVRGEILILTVFVLELAKKFHFSIDWLIGRTNSKEIS